MAIKKISLLLFSIICVISTMKAYADDRYITQTIQINTRLNSFSGDPSWLLILRDEDSQRVVPYIFDFYKPNNFWVAFSFARRYRVTVSRVYFGPFAQINNFCHLENRSLWGESLNITVKGNLTPVSTTSQCYTLRFKDFSFPIVNKHFELSPPE